MSDVTQGNQDSLRDQTGTIQDQAKETDTTGSNQEQKSDQTQQQEKSQEKSPTDQQSKSDGDKSKSPLNEDVKDEKKAEGAPEKYEDFKLPEGVTLEGETLTAATSLFKDLGLSQEGAQKLVDFHVKQITEAADGPVKFWQEQQEAWRKEVTEDPNLGPRIGEIKTAFSKMLDGVGDPALATAFREAMDYTGAGNNPAFIRMMDKISAVYTEGKPVQGQKPSPVREPGKAQGTGPAALWPGLSAS